MADPRLEESEGPHCLLTELPTSDYSPLYVAGPEQWTERVPQKIVDAVLSEGSCLVVGDTPGDPDCFCSAVALARARRHLGLEAKAHIGAPAPQQISRLFEKGELIDQTMCADTIIVVDNDGTRLSSVAEAALKQAKRVVIIDHHETFPSKKLLGLDDDVDLVVWNDPEADAAALMVLATAIQLFARNGPVPDAAWADVIEPLIGGIYSDTRGFDAARTRPSTVSLLRQVIATGGIGIETVLAGFGGGISRDLCHQMYEQIRESCSDYGDDRFGVFTLDGAVVLSTWAVAQEASPELTWSEILFCALDYIEMKTRVENYDLSLFIVGAKDDGVLRTLNESQQAQLPNGALKFSVRTKKGHLAPALAQALGGGGKPHEGGGVSDEPAATLLDRAHRWMAQRADLVSLANTRIKAGA